jgi:hypothetical protein
MGRLLLEAPNIDATRTLNVHRGSMAVLYASGEKTVKIMLLRHGKGEETVGKL